LFFWNSGKRLKFGSRIGLVKAILNQPILLIDFIKGRGGESLYTTWLLTDSTLFPFYSKQITITSIKISF
jgi:hypothetical protein